MESGAVPVESLSQIWTDRQPTDTRFNSVDYHDFHPEGSLVNSKVIKFRLNPLTAHSVYMTQDNLIEVKIKMLTEKGGIIPDTVKDVAPVNNLLHALFSDVRCYVQTKLVDPHSDFYPLKSYIACLLGFNSDASLKFHFHFWNLRACFLMG